MMAKKLAGVFSVLGVLVFLGAWLYFTVLPDRGDIEPMSAEKAWEIGIYLAAAFFLLGLFVSTLGIALVQEVLAESRSRDMEKKFKAKSSYDRIMNMATSAESAAISERAGAAESA